MSLVGLVLAALGVLWVLQGADVIRIEPIGCVADCEPIIGGSVKWLAAGTFSLLAGLVLFGLGIRRRGVPRLKRRGDNPGNER